MSLTTKSLLALALAGSLSACGGGGSGISTVTQTDIERFENTGNIYVRTEEGSIRCSNFDCAITAYGETISVDVTVNEITGSATVIGYYNGSEVTGIVHSDGSYSYALTGGNADQLLYNRTYLSELAEGETKYVAAIEAAIETLSLIHI